MMLSIVIPLYNEEESLGRLYERLTRALGKLGKEYEIIVVDDGSTDKSFQVLEKLHRQDGRLKVISFRRNFGQTAAMSAGFDQAQGDVIVTLDADLQNPPEEIGKLLAKMEEGFDIVSGWRKDRKDKYITRLLPSKTANLLISKLTGVELHDYGCSLKAYRKEVIKNIKLYGEMHRFIPAVASSVGAKVAEVEVAHEPRRHGKSKYGLSRTLRVFLDIILVKFLLSFQTRPIQIFGLGGMIFGFLGGILGVYLAYVRLALQQSIGNRPLLMLSVLLLVLGVQLVMMGLLGEISMRTYFESQNKKTYIIRKQLV